MPSKPALPTWETSTETSITINWAAPIDDGGCPVIEYRVFRDTGMQLGVNDITQSVHADQLLGTNYIYSLTVTDLPAASVGRRFLFKVKVFTAFAVDGVSSDPSASIILADLPDKPSSAPVRNSATS